ncbi:MAG: ABC transporter ATP-binding protein [Lachnospiraceae bacterium]|nr:ABC transporter ATP-binding protein [Lachnospiraceae bacterium]
MIETQPKVLMALKNVSYSYHSLSGEIPALSNISFNIYNEEFLAIVGPSGCGKSTLLSLIAKLNEPEQGTIFVENPDGMIRYPKVGYMLQRDHLFEWRTIYRNVTLGLEINHQLQEERLAYVEQLLEEYGLSSFRNKKPSELSGGMRQRAALIRTLALNPDILLLDEPFSALDYQTRLSVSGDICQLIRKTGKTAILITHDLSEAISIADRIIVLSKRPGTVKKIIPISLSVAHKTPLESRNAVEFRDYFNLLWKEIDS